MFLCEVQKHIADQPPPKQYRQRQDAPAREAPVKEAKRNRNGNKSDVPSRSDADPCWRKSVKQDEQASKPPPPRHDPGVNNIKSKEDAVHTLSALSFEQQKIPAATNENGHVDSLSLYTTNEVWDNVIPPVHTSNEGWENEVPVKESAKEKEPFQYSTQHSSFAMAQVIPIKEEPLGDDLCDKISSLGISAQASAPKQHIKPALLGWTPLPETASNPVHEEYSTEPVKPVQEGMNEIDVRIRYGRMLYVVSKLGNFALYIFVLQVVSPEACNLYVSPDCVPTYPASWTTLPGRDVLARYIGNQQFIEGTV